MTERINALILSDHKTFYKGYVVKNYDKEGTFTVTITKDDHPYIDDGARIVFKDVFIPYNFCDSFSHSLSSF